MKKLLSLLLAVIMLMLSLASCTKIPTVDVLAEGKCQIIYDDALLTAKEAGEIVAAIKAATGSTEVSAVAWSSCAKKTTVSANTILVGCLALSPCRTALEGLREMDYAVGLYEGSLVIAATNTTALLSAIKYFTETVLPQCVKDGSLLLSEEINMRFEGEYPLQSVSIGGVPLASFEIVTAKKPSASEYRLAVILQKLLRERAGCNLKVVTAKESVATGKIYIGSASALKPQACEFNVLAEAGALSLTAADPTGHEALLDYVQNELFAGEKEQLELAAGFAKSDKGSVSCKIEHQGEVRLLTHNVWGSDGAGYDQRIRMLLELYAVYMPDIICLQELAPTMRVYAEPVLKGLGYAEIVTDPDELYHKNEVQTRTPVFYNTATVEMLEGGYTCLAIMDYGKYPELSGGYTVKQLEEAAKSDRSKAVTWGIFRTKATGKEFLAASTHLWWMHKEVDGVARAMQMRELRGVLTNAANAYMVKIQKGGALPILAGGDYNSYTQDAAYATMSNGANPFVNLNDLVPAASKLKNTTNRAYSTYDEALGLVTEYAPPQSSHDYAIDHWFVNAAYAERLKVNYLALVEDLYAFLGSDHTPVMVDVTL